MNKNLGLFALALVLAWPPIGCGGAEEPAPGDRPAAPGAEPARPEILGSVPPFELTDQNGEPFGTDRLLGHVWIANFIFTRCTSVCPAQTTNMAKLQQTLLSQPAYSTALRSGQSIRLVSFSVDPENDTPEVLRQYAERHAADDRTWSFLTGARETIWKLSKDGFRLPVADDPKAEGMPILHDSKFVLVDRLGRIRGYYDGLSAESLKTLVPDIRFVLPEIAPPDYAEVLYTEADGPVTHFAHPPYLTDLDWLETRKTRQLATRDQFPVLDDFRFEDRVEQSGITFLPQILDEQRWRVHVNHYDHAYGVSIADVDGDGRPDIYFLTQAGRNELWRNLGHGTFEDITDRAGVAVADRICVAGAFADVDNDGDADLYVTTVREGNILFLNDGTGTFTDGTEASGLGYSGHSSTPVFFDYDRDGLLDLFLTNVGKYTLDEVVALRMDRANSLPAGEYDYYLGIKDSFGGHLNPKLAEASVLYHNEGGGRFSDVSEQTQLVDTSWSGDATPLDANTDGWIDLYVLNMQGNDEYYENVGGERFVKKSRELFPLTPWGSMGVKVFDFNNDGLMDIYVTDMHSDMTVEDVGVENEKLKSPMKFPDTFLASDGQSIFGNALFQRDARGGYTEVSDAVGAENYWPWGLSVGDLNADGFEDVFLASSMCFPYRYGINSVLLNDRGERFVDSEFILGVEPRPDGRLIKPWFELDASGEDAEHPICRGRSGKVMVWSALGSRSSVIFDLDDDGDLDIVTNEFNSRPMVLVSDLAERKPDLRYLKVDLVGSKSNRDGLGAVVRVFAAGRTLTQTYDGKSGYMSQSLHPLYFGLGTAGSVDRIEVQWPSGKKQNVPGPIRANTRVEIKEG